jgi:EF-hand domain
MAAARKMDELLVSWLGSDAVYESILELIETFREAQEQQHQQNVDGAQSPTPTIAEGDENDEDGAVISSSSPREVIIPPFYPRARKRRSAPHPYECWVYNQGQHQHSPSSSAATPPPPPPPPPHPPSSNSGATAMQGTIRDGITSEGTSPSMSPAHSPPPADPTMGGVRDHAQAIFLELGQDPPLTSPSSVDEQDSGSDEARLRRRYLPLESFVRITKDVCRFPSFFNFPLYQRILTLWNNQEADVTPMEVVTYEMLEWYWEREMEPYDNSDRFFRLVKQPENDYIGRNDFLPFINSLLTDHPGLEFLSTHAEFQDKYALTVITRIFYGVNKCHSGKITARQIRRSDLLDAFYQVDDEEDINKVTRYLSYEHFYVLYWYVRRGVRDRRFCLSDCEDGGLRGRAPAAHTLSLLCNSRFWELDLDRDYRITRDDLLKYGTNE